MLDRREKRASILIAIVLFYFGGYSHEHRGDSFGGE